MPRPKHSGGIDWGHPGRLQEDCPACAASGAGSIAEVIENHSRSLRKQGREVERGPAEARLRVWRLSSYVTFRDAPERIDVHDVPAKTAENALRALLRALRRRYPLAKSWEARWEGPAGNWTHRAEVNG